jgi:Tfp pilus assembly protein PilN
MSVNVQKKGSPTPAAQDHFTATYTVPRVNLMPPEIEAERGFRKVQIGLGAATLAVAGLVVGGFVWASAAASEEQERLSAAQQRTADLTAEQAEYAEVPQVLGELEAADAAQATAMASDVLWYEYLDRLAASYPKDVWLKDMNVLMAPPVDGTAVAAGAAAASTIGTISFSGTGLVHTDVAAWLDALDGIEGFQNATYSTAERTELDGRVVVDFTSTVEVGPEALSLRFEPKAS